MFGAAGIGSRASTSTPAAPAPPAMGRTWSIAVPGVAALLLYAHLLYRIRALNYQTTGGFFRRFDKLFIPWGALTTAGILAVVCALSASAVIAGALDTGHARGELRVSPRVVSASAVITAAVVGVCLPALGAWFGSAVFEDPIGPWLRWALLPLVPIVVAAVVPSRAPRRGGDEWLRLPISATLLVAAGMIVVQQGITKVLWDFGVVWYDPPVFRGGGLLFGAGVALTVYPFRRYRWAFAVALGVFVAAVIDVFHTEIVAVTFAVAVMLRLVHRRWQLTAGPPQETSG